MHHLASSVIDQFGGFAAEAHCLGPRRCPNQRADERLALERNAYLSLHNGQLGVTSRKHRPKKRNIGLGIPEVSIFVCNARAKNLMEENG